MMSNLEDKFSIEWHEKAPELNFKTFLIKKLSSAEITIERQNSELAAAQRTIEAQAAQLDQARELLDEALDLNECVMDFKAARAWLKNNPA